MTWDLIPDKDILDEPLGCETTVIMSQSHCRKNTKILVLKEQIEN